MGIPSYFSHIIKEHGEILKKKNQETIDNLYIDSNSIIYDVVYSIEGEITFDKIYKNVCIKLEYYISTISPEKTVIIAFDGVAPLAKMDQQRLRRHRGIILKELENRIEKVDKKWDTTQITPGTEFMDGLGLYLKNYFKNKNSSYEVIVSTSNDRGEGEHKIYKYIRDNIEKHKQDNSVIYGLDADLIMLSLLHTKYCKNLFLYRETPEFIKSIDSSLDANELYIMDIHELRKKVSLDMNNYKDLMEEEMDVLINDYILICFILGNDFIPHSPCINIRTNGIDIVMDIYRSNFSIINSLTVDGKIKWSNFSKFIKIIGDVERDYLIEEHKKRDKYENRYYPNDSIEEKKFKLNLIPTIDREEERYINPYNDGWETRYYSTLFNVSNDSKRIKEICNNYVGMIEWNYEYYINDCPNWRMSYRYSYAPLFSDIVRYIPFYDTTYIKVCKDNEVKPIIQLCYVLPRETHNFLPEKTRILLSKYLCHYYPTDKKVKWCYCKNLWECHIDLPVIEIEKLEKLVVN